VQEPNAVTAAGAARVTPQRDVRATSSVLRGLEGCKVSLALADGSRLDDVMLISVGHGRTSTLWVFASGIDVFLPRLAVVDAWEAPPARARSAA
jgi:hypothetical protein